MTYQEAITVFNVQFPKLTVLKCIDYDKRHFVLEAVESSDDVDHNDPYFAVDKRTGKVTGFIPAFDLDAFFDAIENRTVYSTY